MRMVFLPFEESSYATFARSASGLSHLHLFSLDYVASEDIFDNIFPMLLKFLVLLIT